MTTSSETASFVWHDLLTPDVEEAKRFYARLLGWRYEIEHATNFAWSEGEADYPLIIVDGVAHGGFVPAASGEQPEWLGFVAMEDVDAAAKKASCLGGQVRKPPFDVPGVGRATVIEDPGGATICPFSRTHAYPAPSGTFLWDELVSSDIDAAIDFYAAMFDWKATRDPSISGSEIVFKTAQSRPAAGLRRRLDTDGSSDYWLPYLASVEPRNSPQFDPAGATFALARPES